jgi:hypothetical protein
MKNAVRALLVVWLIAYPMLPIAPLIAVLIASVIGPPFTVGTDAHGWPRVGDVTPSAALTLIGIPWALGAAVLGGLLVWMRSRRHSAD